MGNGTVVAVVLGLAEDQTGLQLGSFLFSLPRARITSTDHAVPVLMLIIWGHSCSAFPLSCAYVLLVPLLLLTS